jgi:hypothetical protein
MTCVDACVRVSNGCGCGGGGGSGGNEGGMRGSWAVGRSNLLTHAAELREVLLGSLVLLVLIDPLVKVGLDEMVLLLLLGKAGPVFFLELLLLQLELDVLVGVVDLGVLRVDGLKEVELEVVLALQGGGSTGEGKLLGLEVELNLILGGIGDGDGEVDEVLLSLVGGRALGPENCGRHHVSSR